MKALFGKKTEFTFIKVRSKPLHLISSLTENHHLLERNIIVAPRLEYVQKSGAHFLYKNVETCI